MLYHTRGMIWLALAGRPTALQATQHAVRRRRSSKHELRPFHRRAERVTRSVLRTGSPTDTTDSDRSVGAVQTPTGGRLEPCSQHGNVTIWWGDVCAAKATVVQHQASYSKVYGYTSSQSNLPQLTCHTPRGSRSVTCHPT